MTQTPIGGGGAAPPTAAPRLLPEGSSSSRNKQQQQRASSPGRPKDSHARQLSPASSTSRAAAASSKASGARAQQPPPPSGQKSSRAKGGGGGGGDKAPPQSAPGRSALPLGAIQAGDGAEAHSAATLVLAGGCSKGPSGSAADKRETAPKSQELLATPGVGEQQQLPSVTGGGEVERGGSSGLPQPPPKNWSRGKAGRPQPKDGGEAASLPSGGTGKGRALAVGSGGGYWKEGCLQSELTQFHLRKGLAAAQMQSKGSNQGNGNGGTTLVAEQLQPASSSSSTLSPMALAGTQEASGHSGVSESSLNLTPTQQQELQEEVEKLWEENEALKVS